MKRNSKPGKPSYMKTRMPSPDEMKMGTRYFKQKRLEDEYEDIEVEQCAECNRWDEVLEGDIIDDKFYCINCLGEMNDTEE